MSEAEPIQRLLAGAKGLGLSLDESRAGLMIRWWEAVLAKNESLNLTGVTEFQAGIERHLIDSLAFVLHQDALGARKTGIWIDLGTGGGFPGAIAAILVPGSTVHLVDRRQKKIQALAEIVKSLGLKNVRLHAADLRDLTVADGVLHRSADLVFGRGVGRTAAVNEVAVRALRDFGSVLHWKSSTVPEDEVAEAKRGLKKNDIFELEALPYTSFKPCLLLRYEVRR